MKEISLPGSDRPNSSSLPRMHQMSHEHGGNLLSNASSRIHTRTCLRAKSLSYPITSPSAKEEAACTALVPCSLKLLVLQDSSPPLLRSVFSKGCGEPFREYFMGMAVWKNRFNRTYQRGGLGEAGRTRKEESKLFPDFSWISNGWTEICERCRGEGATLIRSSLSSSK